MKTLLIPAYLITFLVFIWIMYIILSRLEYIRCVFRRQIPFVKSSRYLRRAVADEINKHFRDATSVVDIGAGYGRLANYIARHCDVSVVALENMPFTITIARIVKFFTRSPIQIIQCDAFEYLKTSPHFNIGVAYLGPNVNSRLAEYKNTFDVIITLDVPIESLTPTRITDVGHGATRKKKKKYPHKLFVYDFRK